ncbi:hypothetical protein KBA73_00455 [Patescibacteria group bacterium]|nr:hypothetical protein [Patescibacteria group bacterium]
MPKPRKTRPKDEVEEHLEHIYRDEDGSMPDFEVLNHRRSSAGLRIALGFGVFVLFLSGLAWLGLFALGPLRSTSSPPLSLEWHVPTSVTIGDPVELLLDWRNDSLQPLARADVRVSVPPEFRIAQFDPAPTDLALTRWQLGFLPPRANGQIHLKGVFLGTVGSIGEVQAVSMARGQNTDHDQELVKRASTTYEDTVFAGAIQASSSVLVGDKTLLQYFVQNKSAQAIEGVVARLELPTGFVVVTSTTQGQSADAQVVEFVLGTLAPHTTTTIELAGSFAAGAVGDRLVKAAVGQIRPSGFFPFVQTDLSIKVLAPDLALDWVVNGSRENEAHITATESLQALLSYHNQGATALQDISFTGTIQATVDGKTVNPGTLLDLKRMVFVPTSTVATAATAINWGLDKVRLGTLASVEPGAKGTIRYTIPTLPLKKAATNAVIRLTVQASIAQTKGVASKRTVTLPPLVVTFRSDANLTVESRYYTEEGAPIGTGPLPPLVGKTTTYRVFWELNKTLHALDSIDVQAVLPARATWNNKIKSTAGTVSYDADTRMVRWQVDKMPADMTILSSSFEVGVTPIKSEVGRFSPILGETVFQATDSTIKESIRKTMPAQTTDLQSDESANGKGAVKNPS